MMSVVNKARPQCHLSIVLDASGSWGCGAVHRSEWFQLKWAGLGSSGERNFTVKELLPIVVAAALWGAEWSGMTVQAKCDNAAVVWQS